MAFYLFNYKLSLVVLLLLSLCNISLSTPIEHNSDFEYETYKLVKYECVDVVYKTGIP